MRANQVFVAVQVGNPPGRGHVRRVAEADPGFDIRALRSDCLDQRGEGRVKQQCSIFSVVDDVDQLFGMQARVAGVHHHAAAGNCVISFQMAMIVPGEGSDRSAGTQSQMPQSVDQFSNARGTIAIGVAKDRTMRLTRDNLCISELRGRVLDDAGYQQRPIHHQSRLEHYFCLPCIQSPAPNVTPLAFDNRWIAT